MYISIAADGWHWSHLYSCVMFSCGKSKKLLIKLNQKKQLPMVKLIMESLMDDTDDVDHVVIDEPEDNNIIVKVSRLKSNEY